VEEEAVSPVEMADVVEVSGEGSEVRSAMKEL
jgi:hypothetical protein